MRNKKSYAILFFWFAAVLFFSGCMEKAVEPPRDLELGISATAFDLCRRGILMMQAAQGIGRVAFALSASKSDSHFYYKLNDTMNDFFDVGRILEYTSNRLSAPFKAKLASDLAIMDYNFANTPDFFKYPRIFIDTTKPERIFFQDSGYVHVVRLNKALDSAAIMDSLLYFSNDSLNIPTNNFFGNHYDKLIWFKSHIGTAAGAIIHFENRTGSGNAFMVKQTFYLPNDTVIEASYRAVYSSFPDTLKISDYIERKIFSLSDTLATRKIHLAGIPDTFSVPPLQLNRKVCEILQNGAKSDSILKILKTMNIFNDHFNDTIIKFIEIVGSQETVTVTNYPPGDESKHIYPRDENNPNLYIKHRLTTSTKKWSRDLFLYVGPSAQPFANLTLRGFTDSTIHLNMDSTLFETRAGYYYDREKRALYLKPLGERRGDTIITDSVLLYEKIIPAGASFPLFGELANVFWTKGYYHVYVPDNPLAYDNYMIKSLDFDIAMVLGKSLFNYILISVDFYPWSCGLFSPPSISSIKKMKKTYYFSDSIHPTLADSFMTTNYITHVKQITSFESGDTSKIIYFFSNGDSLVYNRFSDTVIAWSLDTNLIRDKAINTKIKDSSYEHSVVLKQPLNSILRILEKGDFQNNLLPSKIVRHYYSNNSEALIRDSLFLLAPDSFLVLRKNIQSAKEETLGLLSWRNRNVFASSDSFTWKKNPGFQWTNQYAPNVLFNYKGALQNDNAFYLHFNSDIDSDSLFGEIMTGPDGKGCGFVYSKKNLILYKINADLNGITQVETSRKSILLGEALTP